jgi:hypothetical protein
MEAMRPDPWRRLRIHDVILVVGFIGWIPYGMLCSFLLRAAFGRIDAIGWLLFPWMIAWGINGIALAGFRCPRCGETFRFRRFYGNAFARRCLWCGQRAYKPIEPNDSRPKPVP